MPGSHVVELGQWLAERDAPPASPMHPVDAALLAAGARRAGSLEAAPGACASECVEFSCNASIALIGDAVFKALPFEVKDECSPSV